MYLEVGKDMLSYVFNQSALSASFGAGAGAFVAYLLATKQETKKELRQELGAIKLANTIASATFQHALGFKQQLGYTLCEDYKASRIAAHRHLKKALNQDQSFSPLVTAYDFREISAFHSNTEKLETLISSTRGC